MGAGNVGEGMEGSREGLTPCAMKPIRGAPAAVSMWRRAACAGCCGLSTVPLCLPAAELSRPAAARRKPVNAGRSPSPAVRPGGPGPHLPSMQV